MITDESDYIDVEFDTKTHLEIDPYHYEYDHEDLKLTLFMDSSDEELMDTLKSVTGWDGDSNFWFWAKSKNKLSFDSYEPNGKLSYKIIVNVPFKQTERDVTIGEIRPAGGYHLEDFANGKITCSVNGLDGLLTWNMIDGVVYDVNNGLNIIEVQTNKKIQFPLHNCTEWTIRSIPRTLETAFSLTSTDFQIVINGSPNDQLKPMLKYEFTKNGQAIAFRFSDMSHRAKLITGFYDYNFKNGEFSTTIWSPSAPLACFGNMMYLISKQGNVIHSANAQNPSILFRMHDLFKSPLPLIIKAKKGERDEVIADSSAMREIELQLVDRWLEPVKILNPMVVTIAMKPIKEDIPTYG
jgi:hypothetical protein